MQRLLIIRGGAVGDFVVTLPVLGALRQAFPQAVIEVMGHLSRAVLALHPHYADQVTDMDLWGLHRLFRPVVIPDRASDRLVSYLKSFDLIVAYLSVSDEILAQNLQRICTTGRVIVWPPHPPTGVHSTDYLLDAVADWVMPVPAMQRCPHIYLDPEAEAVAEALWQRADLPSEGVVAVHPGSGGRHKLWPVAGWQQMIRWIDQRGLVGLVIHGPAEREQDLDRLRGTDMPVWLWTPELSLPQLAALLSRCAVLIGHDSGVSHIAAAVGTPTLALFGPTDAVVWRPRGLRAYVLQPCPPQSLTLDNLTPHMVTQTLDAMLREYSIVAN